MSAGEMYASKVDAIRGAKAARHAARLAKITIVSLVASLTLLAGTASAAPKTPHGPWHLICARALDHPAGYLCHMVKVLPTRRER
jgi:invasion protein IalB